MRSGLRWRSCVHVLLILALAWSVNWKASEPEGVVAELWSALPQTAAPRSHRPSRRRRRRWPSRSRRRPPPKPEPAPPPRDDAQIAIERAKARERPRREEGRAREEAARKAELRSARKRKRDRGRARRSKRERPSASAADEQAEKKKLAEQARKDEARQAAIREANLRRMMSQAGTSDDPAAAGNAARTSGPSASYAGRIKARIKPNIVLTATRRGQPGGDGRGAASRPTARSSAASSYEQRLAGVGRDRAARDRQDRGAAASDVDGRVPPTISIDFRPQESRRPGPRAPPLSSRTPALARASCSSRAASAESRPATRPMSSKPNDGFW